MLVGILTTIFGRGAALDAPRLLHIAAIHVAQGLTQPIHTRPSQHVHRKPSGMRRIHTVRLSPIQAL